MSFVWDYAVKQLKHAQNVQTKYYKEGHRMVEFNIRKI